MNKLSLVNCDSNDCVSALTYIFQLEPNLLLPDELDDILSCTYHCLKGTNLLYPFNNIIEILSTKETERHIIINNKFKIFTYNPWFCKLLILASIKQCWPLFNKDCDHNNAMSRKLILRHALATFRADRNESILLLRLIAHLTEFLDCRLDSAFALDLVAFSRVVSLSPFNGFKQYAEGISEKALHFVTLRDHKELVDIDLLPLRGVSTSKLEIYFAKTDAKDSIFQRMVTRVIEMFSNNIENREGGVLYRILLSIIQDDFDLWTQVVWPQFFKKFQAMDCEGEFFQSLVKYWIPATVALYQMKLVKFIVTTSIPCFLKGYIFFEIRKKFFFKTYSEEDIYFLKKLFSQVETRKIAFQIVGCSFKKDSRPSIPEMLFIKQFLFEQSDILSREEIQALHRFLTEIINIVSENNKVEDEYLKYTKRFLVSTFTYGISLLRTSRENLGAQILTILCSSIKSDVVTRAQIEENLEDDFVQLLKHLKSDKFSNLIEETLLNSKGPGQELCELAINIVEVPKIFTTDFLIKFIEDASKSLSIKACECVKNVTCLIATVSTKESVEILQKNIYRALMRLFEDDWSERHNPIDLFKAVLLFEALNQVAKRVSNEEALNGIHSVCFPAVALMLQQKYYQPKPKQGSSVMSEQWFNARSKMEKIVEALYNNLCQYLLNSKVPWTSLAYPELIKSLVRTIEHSSMRRPTMVSADLLKYATSLIDKDIREDDLENRRQSLMNFKVELLHQTLHKLEQSAPLQNLTIRRNPETRLILHALCLSDTSSQKYFLTWTLNHLLEILSNDESTDATTSAVLHCIEILMSDNTLYNYTLKYAPRVILESVRHFKNRNWIVRNGSIQLSKALIDRFLGVHIGHNNRTKSFDDLIQIFPQIASPFLKILSPGNHLNDSALAVLQFFFESQRRKEPFSTEINLVTRESFLRMFVRLIKENSDLYGLFAARAYVSLCLECHITHIVEHIVEFIIENFSSIRNKHTLRNFMLLLQELYDKYTYSIKDKPVMPLELYRVHKSLSELTEFFDSFKTTEQFDYLLVKVHSVRSVLAILQQTKFNSNNHLQRVWLHNYLPFLVVNVAVLDLPQVLQIILSKEIPECLQVKVLSILVDRFMKEEHLYDKKEDVLKVLVHNVLRIEDTSNYLLLCYFKVILMLFQDCQYLENTMEDLLCKIRQCYSVTGNNYKIFIYLLILTTVEAKTNKDKAFVKSAVKHFQTLQLADEDFTENLSEMLKYLYKNTSCICDRRRVLKIALLLVMEHGLWHFVTFITQSSIPTAIRAVQKMLDFNFLKDFFACDSAAYEFVVEFYLVVSSDSNADVVKNDGRTYYVEEQCVFVDIDCIGRIFIKFLYDFCIYRKMDDWLKCYSMIKNKNKII